MTAVYQAGVAVFDPLYTKLAEWLATSRLPRS